jgi:hypothetical protein
MRVEGDLAAQMTRDELVAGTASGSPKEAITTDSQLLPIPQRK